MPRSCNAELPRRHKPWWKTQEDVSFLFETLFRPFEAEVLRDTRKRDMVGVLRQLDVGIIDSATGEKKVRAFVEVQKRKARVGIEDFGSWMYKRQTLGAEELVVVSESGFSKSVVDHAKSLYPDTVRLGVLHRVENATLERYGTTFLGTTRIFDKWWFASVFVQYDDDGEVYVVPSEDRANPQEKIFGKASLMDMMTFADKENSFASGLMTNLIFRLDKEPLSYGGRPLKCIMITAEKQRRIWDPKTYFFTYNEVYPNRMQRGIALTSTFNFDDTKKCRLTIVISPDPENISGRGATLAGQFEFF